MTRIAFVGLGNMGTPMSRRLIEAGHEVAGFDPVEAARDRLATVGGVPAESAAAAAEGAGAVILMLPNSDIVESVAAELMDAEVLARGAVVIDMSSSEPLRTRALRDRITAGGARFADAPVSGGVTGAVAGTLTVMLGADDADAAEIRELLAPLGTVSHCGEVGAGHALKALNNLLSATHLWATGEAMLVGERFGLDPEVMLDVINRSSGRSGSTQNKWPNFVLPGTFDSGFELRLMLKDMRIAAGLAEQLKVPLALGAQAVERWARSAADLPTGADHTRVAQWIYEHAGPADRGDEGGS